MNEESALPTREPCSCGYLEGSAADANTPIRFDPDLNEYHIIYSLPGSGQGVLMIYYCPMCGGSAPQSRRGALFTQIPPEEEDRLRALTREITTVGDVSASLGIPDREEAFALPEGMVWPSTRDSPPELPVRTLDFRSASEVADIQVSVYRDGRAHATFHAKYIGPHQGRLSEDQS
jgi:hypothetical protein